MNLIYSNNYRKLILFIPFLCAIVTSLAGQTPQINRCGYKLAMNSLEQKYPGYKAAEQRQFDHINNKEVTSRNEDIYRIPVVFHVIYNSERQNIDDKYIHSQLDILNKAYRNTHDNVDDTRPVFKPLAGDAEIEFFLATEDPDGKSTTGITRTYTETKTFGDLTILIGGFDLDLFERMKHTDKGGYDGWPSDRYLNIWVADAGISFLGIYLPALLGLATPPATPDLPENWPEGAVDGIKDGVFLQYQTIGLDNPYSEDLQGLVSQGRTAVHEVGHYLGLRHVNGDEECGTDGIDDTPVMNLSTQAEDCPGSDVNTCDETLPDDQPDMWENYMDYSNDICQTMFTEGQVSHMRKVLTTQRDTLYNWNLKTFKNNFETLNVYPNPSNGNFNLSKISLGGTLLITDLNGQPVYRKYKLNSSEISTDGLYNGIYIVKYENAGKVYMSKLVIF